PHGVGTARRLDDVLRHRGEPGVDADRGQSADQGREGTQVGGDAACLERVVASQPDGGEVVRAGAAVDVRLHTRDRGSRGEVGGRRTIGELGVEPRSEFPAQLELVPTVPKRHLAGADAEFVRPRDAPARAWTRSRGTASATRTAFAAQAGTL